MSVTNNQFSIDLTQLVAQANSLYSGSATTLNGALALFAAHGVYPTGITNPSFGTAILDLIGGGPLNGTAYIFTQIADLISQANTLYGSITTLQDALQAFYNNGIYLVSVFAYRVDQQAAPEPDTTTYNIAYVLSSNAPGAPAANSGLVVYGDGADGDVTFDGTTTILGLVPSGSAYTLTRDIYPDTMTVNSGVTINTANFEPYCRTALINNGIIANNGAAGSGASAGTATAAGSLGAGSSGGAGSTTAGSAGTNLTNCLGSAGGAGGAGGSGAGGAAGTVTAPTAAVGGNVFHTLLGLLTGRTKDAAVVKAGTGGGGGTGDGTNSGGGGGAGAGHVLIAAPAITGTGAFQAKGGNGGNAAATGNTGGGGGGGGAVIGIITSQPLASTLTTAVNGGVGGAKNGTGVVGSNGTAGTVITLIA